LILNGSFKDIRGSCTISRGGAVIYESGELLTGEDNMSHSLMNLEDHHFKYPQFRVPGDVHIHSFGTMKLSYPNRPALKTGDKITVAFAGMGPPLVNYVKKQPSSAVPIQVQEA
jgi:hypothetical protein